MFNSTISEYGEKELIEQFIKPLFNPEADLFGIGDDCAIIRDRDDELTLLSTDRVPADLIAFKLGLINYHGLGIYLAQLNISDIVACGGKPIGLLLNFGLPRNLHVKNFNELLQGVKNTIDKYNCKVIGGDITMSTELSISATSIGKVKKENILLRSNAKAGDHIFISRPIGFTPIAFEYFCNLKPNGFRLTILEEEILIKQFTDMYPLGELGLQLANSGHCTSCMDNTDGVGQCILELSQSSMVHMQVKFDSIKVDPLIKKVCLKIGVECSEIIFNAGADFSLVGTLDGQYTEQEYESIFNNRISIIGQVRKGDGVSLERKGNSIDLKFNGWDYFTSGK